MKKTLIFLLTLSVFITSIAGCKTKPTVDLSKYSFINTTWTRTTGSCTETIYFNDDGNCGYYCACGNPVNDDDLCEGYTYDPKTKTIHLDFSATGKDTVTKIIVKSYDDETLVLDFDGDIRKFKKAKEWQPNTPDTTVSYENEEYVYLQFPGDIFVYDLKESVVYEEDEILPIAHEKWKLVFYNGDLFILTSQESEAVAYYGSDKNYTWSVEIYASDDTITLPVTMENKDLTYIYSMEDAPKGTSIDFDDIEIFASLVKTSNDGLITATTSLAYYKNVWYWRSEIINENIEGWPEYVVLLPENLAKQINASYSINAK